MSAASGSSINEIRWHMSVAMGLQFQAAWLEREGTHTRRRLSFDSGPKWADIVPE